MIGWETGRSPDSYRGVDKKDKYRAEFYNDMDIIPDINEDLWTLYMTEEIRKSLQLSFKKIKTS